MVKRKLQSRYSITRTSRKGKARNIIPLNKDFCYNKRGRLSYQKNGRHFSVSPERKRNYRNSTLATRQSQGIYEARRSEKRDVGDSFRDTCNGDFVLEGTRQVCQDEAPVRTGKNVL